MGIAFYPQDGEDVQTLLRNADTALYQAKKQGRNAFQYYLPSMNIQATKMLEFENDLRIALEKRQFYLDFQPIITTKNGHIRMVEALIRWNHPSLGPISPNDFISVAEENGLIVALNEWVLGAAFTQLKRWKEAKLPPLTIAVNISAGIFSRKELVDRLVSLIEKSDIDTSYLEIEVTESFAIGNIENAIAQLTQLKKTGVRIAIDDFGTGHSSLNYLRRLPVDTIKIDRSFVQGCTKNKHDAEIVEAVIRIAHSRGLQVIAEGVETSEQRDILTRLQADALQGYLFSQPVPPEEIPALLKKN